jgi:hypothetical protein
LGYKKDRHNGTYFLKPFRPGTREGEDASGNHFALQELAVYSAKYIPVLIQLKEVIPKTKFLA